MVWASRDHKPDILNTVSISNDLILKRHWTVLFIATQFFLVIALSFDVWDILVVEQSSSEEWQTVPHRKPDGPAFKWPYLGHFLCPTFESIWPPFCIVSKAGPDFFLRLA
jgi:hypothetical protein